MRISQALIFFTHLLALLGFAALSLTGAVSAVSIFVFSVSLVISFINEKYGKGYYLGSRLSSILAILLIIYVGSSILVFGQEIIYGLLDFLIFTQVLKLLGKKTPRDIIQIYILSFFQFLAGTVLTQSFSYGLVFIVYIAVSIWAIMVYSMYRDANDQKSAGNDTNGFNQDPKVITPLFLSTTFILSFCIFIVAALIFISVPRLKSGFFQGSFLTQVKLRTGFSEEVALGKVGEIKLDDSPVMRVHVLNPEELSESKPLYWRGISLDYFDGVGWKSSGHDYRLLKAEEDGVFITSSSNKKLLHQEIITEPLDSNILFSAEKPVGFKVKGRERLERVNDSFMILGPVPGRMKYYAYSDIHTPLIEELRQSGTNYPEFVQNTYLQLDHNAESIERLARDITNGLQNPYDKAQSIKLYLLENYGYTRTLEKSDLENPLEDFLFRKKSGHCEYFATAMAVLLRESGIPARIVNGFVGGQWNPHGEFFLIRESDAHSWAEAYFPSHGWVAFDATPESESSFHDQSALFALSYIDYLKFRWQRYVIDFNQRDQMRLLSGLENSLKFQGRKFSSLPKLRSDFDKSYLAVVGILIIALFLFIKRPGILGLIKHSGKRRISRASIQYDKALKLLSKRGYEKPSSMTPNEFLDQLKKVDGRPNRIFEEITSLYLSIRYGGSDNKLKLSKLSKLVRELK